MKNHLVSIIVPIYKVEQYLENCINTIVNQTYKNIEIILVDDGSPDKCPLICDNYANKDKRIKVIHKENGGLSSARNCGIRIAKGDYLIFVDSDDFIHPQLVENLYKASINNNFDMVFSNICKVYESHTEYIKQKYDDYNKNLKKMNKPYYYLLYNDYSYDVVPACGKIYKKMIFEKLKFKEGYINEDEFIILDILNICNSIGYLDEKLYYYYQRPFSITKNSKFDKKNHIEALKNRINYFENNEAEKEIKVIAAFKYLSLLFQQLYKSNCSIEEKEKLKLEISNIKKYIINNKNGEFNYRCLSSSNAKKLRLIKFSFTLTFIMLRLKSKIIK